MKLIHAEHARFRAQYYSYSYIMTTKKFAVVVYNKMWNNVEKTQVHLTMHSFLFFLFCFVRCVIYLFIFHKVNFAIAEWIHLLHLLDLCI